MDVRRAQIRAFRSRGPVRVFDPRKHRAINPPKKIVGSPDKRPISFRRMS
jgi:hypothetical protein